MTAVLQSQGSGLRGTAASPKVHHGIVALNHSPPHYRDSVVLKAGTARLDKYCRSREAQTPSAGEKKRPRPARGLWSTPSLPTCHSYTRFVSPSGTAGSRQGLLATRQAPPQ